MAGTNAEYMRRYRLDPEKREQNRLIISARENALRRLGQDFPDLLLPYLNQERAKLGLGPVGKTRS